MAIVLALAVSAVGVTLFGRAIAAIVGVVKLGRPVAGLRSKAPAERWKHLLAESLGHTRMLQWTKIGIAHWFVFVGFGALFFTLITAYGQLFDQRFALPLIGHWVVYEWVSEIIAWVMIVSILFLMIIRFALRNRGRESRFFGSRTWQAVYVELTILGIGLCVIALRGLEFQLLGGETSPVHFPLTFWLFPAGLSTVALETAIVVIAARQDHHLDGLDDHHRPEHDDGRGLAPVHRLAQHLVQARVLRQAGPGRPAADHDRRQAAGLRAARGAGRGRPARREQDRGLHLEGPARLHQLHRVRPLPVPVPGLAHREAAVAEAVDHGPARARVRQGALSASGGGRPGDAAGRVAQRGGPAAGRPDPGHRRAGRDRRPGRAVVLHQLRRLRPAVPGRHRARRSHHGPAALPGDDGGGVPERAQRAVQGPGEQGQPVEPEPAEADGLGQGPRRSRCRSSATRSRT